MRYVTHADAHNFDVPVRQDAWLLLVKNKMWDRQVDNYAHTEKSPELSMIALEVSVLLRKYLW